MIHLHRIILIGSTLLGSWLAMQAVHEFGHVCGAWITGGRVAQVVLYPLTISRTDVIENRSPLIVVWAGPVVGVLLPLVAWLVMAAAKLPGAFLARFFAGFCLLANGLYIGVGSLGRVGDCGVMIQHGSPLWQLWAFGAVTAPLGLWLWNGQGPNFGFGVGNGQVSTRAAYCTLAICVGLLVLEFAVGGE